MSRNENAFKNLVPTVTLARVYSKQGLLKEAAAVYRKLLTMEPGNQTLENALADIEKRLQGQKRVPSAGLKTILSRLKRWQEVVVSRKIVLDQQRPAKTNMLVIQGPVEGAAGFGSAKDRSTHVPFAELDSCIKKAARQSGIIAEVLRASSEEELTEMLQETAGGYDVVILDPGQSAGGRPSVRNALAAMDVPIIEVHPINSLDGAGSSIPGMADLSTAHLSGFGRQGYTMAVRAAADMARQSLQTKAGKNIRAGNL